MFMFYCTHVLTPKAKSVLPFLIKNQEFNFFFTWLKNENKLSEKCRFLGYLKLLILCDELPGKNLRKRGMQQRNACVVYVLYVTLSPESLNLFSFLIFCPPIYSICILLFFYFLSSEKDLDFFPPKFLLVCIFIYCMLIFLFFL